MRFALLPTSLNTDHACDPLGTRPCGLQQAQDRSLRSRPCACSGRGPGAGLGLRLRGGPLANARARKHSAAQLRPRPTSHLPTPPSSAWWGRGPHCTGTAIVERLLAAVGPGGERSVERRTARRVPAPQLKRGVRLMGAAIKPGTPLVRLDRVGASGCTTSPPPHLLL